jgi:competence protein ComEA
MKDLWKIAFSVVCSLLGAGVILLVSSRPGGEPIVLQPPPTPAPIYVHVAGAVAQPGLYQLTTGNRVGDAIQAAGGLLPEADPQALNLAAILGDGEKVLVPTPPAQNPTEESADTLSSAPLAAHLININTADQAELESLPGIGPVLAQRIIKYRNAYGLFATIEDIQVIYGIDSETFEKIKHLITVDTTP